MIVNKCIHELMLSSPCTCARSEVIGFIIVVIVVVDTKIARSWDLSIYPSIYLFLQDEINLHLQKLEYAREKIMQIC